ncbi:hypothetical protein V1477_003460 [Vespula maculifrons]|uniref:Uncharacterized protein n=1 Tax=Vespula maculifrons TaxID=7453 RepID=A0ABD2CSV2_VESMC
MWLNSKILSAYSRSRLDYIHCAEKPDYHCTIHTLVNLRRTSSPYPSRGRSQRRSAGGHLVMTI